MFVSGWNSPAHGDNCCCEDCLPPGHGDDAQVDQWRLDELLKAGYPIGWAQLVAGSSTDLHEAVELVTVKGCPPATAAKILL
jgi:hypothetical protein